MTRYEVGQRWAYRTRQQDVGSTLLIGGIDRGTEPVVHVRISGVVSPRSAGPIVIGHMPFSAAALDSSVLELLELGAQIPADFSDAVFAWAGQQGGVFGATVSAAIDDALSALAVAAPVDDDPFDGIVRELRATRSAQLVEELYRRLFSLEHWFFLREPGDPRVPVQWVFPDGVNETPALLAFTSRERAESAAVSLGLYAEGAQGAVMEAPIRDAVQWVAGPACANEWLCFNLSRENFPIYVRDAVLLLELHRGA